MAAKKYEISEAGRKALQSALLDVMEHYAKLERSQGVMDLPVPIYTDVREKLAQKRADAERMYRLFSND